MAGRRFCSANFMICVMRMNVALVGHTASPLARSFKICARAESTSSGPRISTE